MPDPAHGLDDPAQTIARLQLVLDQQAKDLVRLNDFLAKRETFIREGLGVFASFHQRALDHHDQERSRFEQELASRTAAIANLSEVVALRDAAAAHREVAVARMEGDRAARDAEIARLQAGTAHRDTLRTLQEEHVARLQAEIAQRDMLRTLQEQHVARLQGQLHADNNPLQSRTIRLCYGLVLSGFKAVDSLWIGFARIIRGALRRG